MIKTFLIFMLGSFSGNEMMVPSANYAVQAGIERKAFRLGLDLGYTHQETHKNAFRQGNATLMTLFPTLTITPQIRSNLRPFVGIGYGYVKTDREIALQTMAGWKEWETLDSGYGMTFSGGVEYRASKRVYIVAGVKQLMFKTKLTEHRQQHPKHEDSLDYKRVHDVDLSGLTGNLGLRVVF